MPLESVLGIWKLYGCNAKKAHTVAFGTEHRCSQCCMNVKGDDQPTRDAQGFV